MSRNYDNWERLVAAVLKRELIWKLCHEDSRTPSLRSSVSLSSDFTNSSFRLSSFSPIAFSDPKYESFESAKLALPFQRLAEIKISANPGTNEIKTAGRLVHFNSSPFVFSLQELLVAPSYVLGDEIETFRNTYIVRLNEDVTFVAKRFNRGSSMQADLEQTQQSLESIGSIEHDNVLKLRGCYLSQDENLGFFDYLPQGSVYKILHGKRSENLVNLDWRSRIRIAVGAARGLAHIHRQFGGGFKHGNIKSSNIFLNSQQYGCVADISPAITRVSAYDPPSEVLGLKWKNFSQSQATDVYNFGVLLIELISGRSPWRYYMDGRGRTFADWAVHNMRDGWTAMVFDKGLLKDPLGMQGMWDMLVVASSCVEKEPKKRPSMDDVEERLEFILHYTGAYEFPNIMSI